MNSGWLLKKSLILRVDKVNMANVLVLSKSTSEMGGGTLSSGFDAVITVLKYVINYYEVILNGRLVQISLSG